MLNRIGEWPLDDEDLARAALCSGGVGGRPLRRCPSLDDVGHEICSSGEVLHARGKADASAADDWLEVAAIARSDIRLITYGLY